MALLALVLGLNFCLLTMQSNYDAYQGGYQFPQQPNPWPACAGMNGFRAEAPNGNFTGGFVHPQAQVHHPQVPLGENAVNSALFLSTTQRPAPGTSYELFCKAGNQFIEYAPSGGLNYLKGNSKRDGLKCQYTFEAVDGGKAYVVKSAANPNLVFDVKDGSEKDDTPIIAYSRHGQPNQQFRFEPSNEPGFFKIIGVKHGKCLQVNDDHKLVHSKCDQGDNQKFALHTLAGTQQRSSSHA